jgi:predicted GH43/DUF377 family glycosyl hydrolase
MLDSKEEKRRMHQRSRSSAPWNLSRLGILMEPDPTDPWEAEGVLNPAAARGPDGQLYLLPRLVAAGNYSRIGLARVVFDRSGTPVGVERQGVVLEPEEPYERYSPAGGGVEDPRVTYLARQRRYLMTYTALGPTGPRIALALSPDLRRWERLGLARFTPCHDVDLGTLDNKDALVFPEAVRAPDGRLALALIHRPTFRTPPWWLREPRPSLWLSYAPLDDVVSGRAPIFGQHHFLAGPQQGWERLKVGGGTPPVRTAAGWLLLYHGVCGQIVAEAGQPHGLCYSAGVLLLDLADPRRVLYRSARSILQPRTRAEREGIVPCVVFPTGVDARENGVLDVYYGMADSRIGVARGTLNGLLRPALPQAA